MARPSRAGCPHEVECGIQGEDFRLAAAFVCWVLLSASPSHLLAPLSVSPSSFLSGSVRNGTARAAAFMRRFLPRNFFLSLHRSSLVEDSWSLKVCRFGARSLLVTSDQEETLAPNSVSARPHFSSSEPTLPVHQLHLRRSSACFLPLVDLGAQLEGPFAARATRPARQRLRLGRPAVSAGQAIAPARLVNLSFP